MSQYFISLYEDRLYISLHLTTRYFQLENVEDELKCTRMFPKAFGVCAAGNEVFVTSEEDQHLYSIRSGVDQITIDLTMFVTNGIS